MKCNLMYNFHIANSAICILGVGNVPSGDVPVTVSTKFLEKKKKNGKGQIFVSCSKKITYFWFPQGMIIFPGGVQQKWNFWRRGGDPFCELILENPEGRWVIGKNPFHGGKGWIFSGTTQCGLESNKCEPEHDIHMVHLRIKQL